MNTKSERTNAYASSKVIFQLTYTSPIKTSLAPASHEVS